MTWDPADGHGREVSVAYLNGRQSAIAGGRVFDLRLQDVDLGNAKELIRFEGTQLTSENRFDNVCLDVPAGCTGITWNNPQNGNSGTITPVKDGYAQNGAYCREFQQTITISGQAQNGYGTACQQPDGSWKIVQ